MAAIENRGQPQQEFLLRLSLLFSWGVVRWKQTTLGGAYMKIETCTKAAFVVIGKEGATSEGPGFLQKLWAEANARFCEV